MRIELTKQRYQLYRKIIKGVIILLWILIVAFPIAIVTIEVICNSCSIPSSGGTITSFHDHNRIPFYIWGFIEPYIYNNITEYFTPPNAFFYISLTLFWLGLIASFGNIKQNYKNQIINKNLGYLSALLIILAIIGIFFASTSVNSGYSHPSINISYKGKSWRAGAGLTFSIILIIIISTETFILNRIKIIQEEAILTKETKREIRNSQILRKLFCSSCGAEILDNSGDFCSKCGAPLK